MSARARFLVPLLWAVKIESLSLFCFEGRGLPAVEVEAEEARSEERELVKAMFEDVVDGALDSCGALVP